MRGLFVAATVSSQSRKVNSTAIRGHPRPSVPSLASCRLRRPWRRPRYVCTNAEMLPVLLPLISTTLAFYPLPLTCCAPPPPFLVLLDSRRPCEEFCAYNRQRQASPWCDRSDNLQLRPVRAHHGRRSLLQHDNRLHGSIYKPRGTVQRDGQERRPLPAGCRPP